MSLPEYLSQGNIVMGSPSAKAWKELASAFALPRTLESALRDCLVTQTPTAMIMKSLRAATPIPAWASLVDAPGIARSAFLGNDFLKRQSIPWANPMGPLLGDAMQAFMRTPLLRPSRLPWTSIRSSLNTSSILAVALRSTRHSDSVPFLDDAASAIRHFSLRETERKRNEGRRAARYARAYHDLVHDLWVLPRGWTSDVLADGFPASREDDIALVELDLQTSLDKTIVERTLGYERCLELPATQWAVGAARLHATDALMAVPLWVFATDAFVRQAIADPTFDLFSRKHGDAHARLRQVFLALGTSEPVPPNIIAVLEAATASTNNPNPHFLSRHAVGHPGEIDSITATDARRWACLYLYFADLVVRVRGLALVDNGVSAVA